MAISWTISGISHALADRVQSITLSSGGSGYTGVPSVSLTGGGGSGATATATLTATTVASATITSGGSYASAPAIGISGGGGSGATAVATLAPTTVASVAMTPGFGGSGYTSAPSVIFSGGGGSGAAGTAQIDTMLDGITVTNPGSGYSSPPDVELSGTWDVAPTAVATVAGGEVTGIEITGYGSGIVGEVTASLTGGGGSGATAVVDVITQVVAVTVTSAGSGYTSSPTVSFSGGGGSGAAAQAFLTPSALAAITITNPGSGYTSTPSIGISDSGGGVAVAVLTPTSVASVAVSAAGTGYTSVPTVSFSGGSGSGAAATAELYGTTLIDVPLGTAGIVGVRRTRRNMARDEVTFEEPGAALDSTPLFALNTEVTLERVVDGTPTTWFVGRVVEVPRAGAGRMESISYRLAGTWWYFENLVFQQVWPLDATANLHLPSPETFRRAVAIAGMASTTGLRQNLKDFILDVLDWLIDSNTPAVTQYTAAEIPAGFNVPFTRLDSPTCAEALQRATQWIPDAVAWFDCSLSPPKFNLHRRSGATTLEFALTDLSEVSATPRNELKIDRLLIQFVTRAASGLFILNEDKDPEDTTGREWGAVVLTVDNDYLPLPAGLAGEFREGLSVLQYSGHLVIEEDECAQTVRPGHLINITGGPSEWTTMAAQVQEVVEELDTGRTIVRFGPANHIRLDDLIEILKIARNQADQFGGFSEILKTGKQSNRMKQLTQDFSPAAAKPTALEIATAIQDAYSGQPAPWEGDEVDLTIDDTVRYTAYVHYQDPATPGADDYIVGFTVGSVTRYAKVLDTGAARTITQALTAAGAVPTSTEIATALVAAFSGAARPHHDERVVLTVSGAPKLLYRVDFNVTSASGLRVVAFTISGRTWYAVLQQLGVYAP